MNTIASDTINILKDFFINYPDNLYIFIKHLYTEHDAGWFTYFICLCILSYLVVYVITHAGSKKYKTRDALKNVAYETNGQYTETKNGEKITGCRYLDRVFEINNSNPKINPYFEIRCSIGSNITLTIEQGLVNSELEPESDLNIKNNTHSGGILSDTEIYSLLKDLLNFEGEMDIENGKIVIRVPFYLFADEDESVFVDEQKIYDTLAKQAKLAALIENYSSNL